VRRHARQWRWLAATSGLAILLLGAWLLLAGLLLGADLAPAARAEGLRVLLGHWPALLLLGLLWAAAGGALGVLIWRRHGLPAARLLEQARVLREGRPGRPLAEISGAELQDLAQCIDALAAQREALREDVAAQVADAARGIAEERNRLAALMHELGQSVLVCNLDGRILLYNELARRQFRALSAAPQMADGGELIGLGRSIHAVFERALIEHALERVRQRRAEGDEHPSVRFIICAPGGRLWRAQLAAVSAAAGPGIGGFVLMLEDFTRQIEEGSARDRLLHALSEGTRASLGTLQAALELLEDAEVDAATRARLLHVVGEETRGMGERLRDSLQQAAVLQSAPWTLEEMSGRDFLAAARQQLQARCRVEVSTGEVEAALWLRLDSYALLQVLELLAQRLQQQAQALRLELQLNMADPAHAHLDLGWVAGGDALGALHGFEDAQLPIGGSVSIAEVMQRHGAAVWLQRGSAERVVLRFLLPLAAPVEPAARAAMAVEPSKGTVASRPEFYDFDLFAAGEASHGLDDQRLDDLSYTVFDCETTGLDPAGGDEILQIGALRVVNGKLRRSESFEQLVDPRRRIAAASIPFHGITEAMVAGQPGIERVLPAFHAFARDSVLVAHNAAFDLRFLQLKETSTGVRFEQPVLDTLLLSAVVHPHQASHSLEALAERFGLAVQGRHTALGDATLTAEIFLRLLPLLAERGIHTLGAARAAAQESYFARLRY